MRGSAERPASTSKIRLETRRFEKRRPGCGADYCVHVVFEFPEIVSGLNADIRAQINGRIQQVLLEVSGEARQLEGLARRFEDNWIDAAEGKPWFDHRIAAVMYESPITLSVVLDWNSYTGGAHGIERRDYLNFRLDTGALLELRDILLPGCWDRLSRIAERHFWTAKMLDASAGLGGGCTWFGGDGFILNQTFGIGKKGLVFFFNEYEIAAHACGATELWIPYSDIPDLLRPEFRAVIAHE